MNVWAASCEEVEVMIEDLNQNEKEVGETKINVVKRIIKQYSLHFKKVMHYFSSLLSE